MLDQSAVIEQKLKAKNPRKSLHLYISYEHYYWLLSYKRRNDVKNTASNQVHQMGKGESA